MFTCNNMLELYKTTCVSMYFVELPRANPYKNKHVTKRQILFNILMNKKAYDIINKMKILEKM